ncbi:type IV pilus modification protein PilV [Acinetobacter sp.]|jgi:type IV pilus assembly protein PilV|uniref:type IV pilus modification protein PilV n=1 Tax=Acinetobacter sp. TaxID=472 RepID=UPI002821D1DB|nr:type IV pilus modification protein PilV [Acinetobacter sp.]MDR2249022.1 type IV pilus modification protein PilV [Acinetobacter sp.]
MKGMEHQRGMGMMEILVALLILAIGILGFVALQYRALEASSESTSRVQAITLARDIAERIRVNRNSLAVYSQQLQDPSKQKDFVKNCFQDNCSDTDLADFDVAQVVKSASSLGLTMNMVACPKTNNRQCIYIAWGDTSATNGTGAGDCTQDTSYNDNSTCVIMETY